MRKIVIGVVLAVPWMKAQKFQDLLLPQERHIIGVVVDSEGKPVVEARIDHSNDNRQVHQTDSEGRFELNTRAPVIVVRKSGFNSSLVRTQDAAEVRVTLQKSTQNRIF